jgi:hypothetical protein
VDALDLEKGLIRIKTLIVSNRQQKDRKLFLDVYEAMAAPGMRISALLYALIFPAERPTAI